MRVPKHGNAKKAEKLANNQNSKNVARKEEKPKAEDTLFEEDSGKNAKRTVKKDYNLLWAGEVTYDEGPMPVIVDPNKDMIYSPEVLYNGLAKTVNTVSNFFGYTPPEREYPPEEPKEVKKPEPKKEEPKAEENKNPNVKMSKIYGKEVTYENGPLPLIVKPDPHQIYALESGYNWTAKGINAIYNFFAKK